MNLIDTLSVTLSFCEDGSAYKSWVLVCKLWNTALKRLFPDPKWLFGNKLINIIDGIGGIEYINNTTYVKTAVINNKKIPNYWKRKYLTGNTGGIYLNDPLPSYSLEYMSEVYNQTGVLFSNYNIFYRPFRDDDEFMDFYNELDDNYNFRFITTLFKFRFHHSVSVSCIHTLHTSDVSPVYVDWLSVPVTHKGHLSEDDWILLEQVGIKFLPAPTNIYDVSEMNNWVSYPTTYIDMLLNVGISPNYIGYIHGLMIHNHHTTQEQAIEIINNSNNHERVSQALFSLE